MKIKIKKWGINGEGIGYYQRKPVFIPGAIPSEIVSFEPVEKTDRYWTGHLEKVLAASAQRKYPFCEYSRQCGGCPSMHVKYRAQMKMKENLLRQALKKYTGMTPDILPIKKNPMPLGYRNACKMPLKKVDGHWQCGMYRTDSQTFVPVRRCFIHSKLLEQTRQRIVELMNEFVPEGFKTLVLKELDEKIQIIFVTKRIDIPSTLIEQCARLEGVVSIWQNIKETDSHETFGPEMKHLALEEKLVLALDGLTLELLPSSFFQLNTQQAKRLYQTVVDQIMPCDTLVEAYCGIGAIGLLAANKAKQLIGIEYNAQAVENAENNARINQIHRARYIAGDAGTELKQLKEKVDVLVVDPPRSGLDKRMVDAIRQKQPEQIIYVSCNTSTLAKNIAQLKEYAVQRIQPVDMFSQTAHVESIVTMSKKR
ncbi:MAG: 23S rRNA (uracil(1939)-C(5))-methyltransferase RlmD [Erysipelotrichaceae bacterium]|nr:23S rRNA (uracil(1939)-C(5))-methyltransferase RlmD [Erysipelotrichaceae bacterium]